MHATRALQSNIGRQVLKYSRAVSIKHTPGCVEVVGERGTETVRVPPYLAIEFVDDGTEKLQAKVSVSDQTDRKQRAMWGTMRTLIANAVIGVTDGFSVPIRIVGVGYRALMENGQLSLKLGYSHQILLDIPKTVSLSIPAPQRILMQGNNLEQVTQFAAIIRRWRPPEPYNQKGIFVGNETIKKKEGKKR